MNARLAFYFLPILNAASIPGRIITGFLANTMGSVNMLIPTALATGIIALCLIGIHNTGGLIVYAILSGFFSGGFSSMPSVTLTNLTPDLSRLGTRMGICSLLCSLGSLCGRPISGARDVVGVAFFSGMTPLVTGVLFLFARWVQAGMKLRVKF